MELPNLLSVDSLLQYYELKEKDCTTQVSDDFLEIFCRSHCKIWRSMPSQLEMKSSTANDIDRESKPEEEKRLNFFQRWKQERGSDATYLSLIDALLEFECRQDAESVCKLLKKSLSKDSPSTKQSSENASLKQSVVPDSGVLEDLEQQLEINLKHIMNRYASYVRTVRLSIKNKGITATELCSYLMALPAFNSGARAILLSGSREKLKKATSIEQIFNILAHECTSFLNYDIFQSMLDEYGIDQDTDKLNYPEYLKQYAEMHKLKEFAVINPLFETFCDASKEVILLIDIDSTRSLAKLVDLHKSFSDILGINRRALRILDVKDSLKYKFGEDFDFDQIRPQDADRWKVHIVDGLPEHRSEPVYGKWIITSNYDYESEVNVTKLWHKLKGDIEHGKLPVVKMECPTKPKESPPEIHVTTSKANMEPVGRSILAVVKHDIQYDIAGNPSEKKTLKWSESQSDTDHEDTDSEGEEKVNEEAKPGAGPAAPSGDDDWGDDDSEDEEQFIKEAMSGEKKIKRKLAHSILVGPPGSGKSSLMNRLLGRPRKESSSSTGVSESVVVVNVDMTTPSTFHSITVVDSEWKEVEYHESLVKQIAEEGVNSPTQAAAATMNVVTETQPAEVSPDTTTIHNTNLISTQAAEVGTESIAIATDKPVSSINSPQVRKIIKSVIKNYGGYKNFKKFLKNSFSIYLRDTGGQLVFQEMLPLLVFGPSIFLFVFRLDQDLKSKFSVEYRMKAGEVLNRYTSSITIEEAFLQCLASVYAMDVPSKSGVKTHESLVFVIGTHKDKLEPSLADKKIADVNKSLDSLIKKSNFEDLVQYVSKGQVMFTVNNTSDSDEDFKLIQSRVSMLISKREMFTIEYPIRYLLFSLELQDTKRNVLSLKECKDMAKKYLITDDQLLQLLEFLHIRVGIIRYFDKEGVRHIVIKETQVLFNVLTNFIIQSFSDDGPLFTLSQENRELKQGIFKASLFKEIVGNVDSITPDQLLQLLVHLRLTVSFTERGKEKYFLPSILTHVPESGEEELTDIPPLAIQFNCGHCPKGLFGVLVTHLMAPDPSQLQGAITSITLIPHKIFKYHVSFEVCSLGVRDEISLKVHAAHLEIKFFPELSEDRQSLSVCNDIRLTLENCINRSLEDLLYKVAFHLCLKCDQCSELHEVDFANLKLHCQQTRKARCISQGKWWFSDSEAAAKDSTASAEGRLNKDPDSTQRLSEQDITAILQKLSKYSHKWTEIGEWLGFMPRELSNIEARPLLLLKGSCSYLSAMLSDWQQWAPGDARGSKSYATLISLREAVDKAGLGLTAREL